MNRCEAITSEEGDKKAYKKKRDNILQKSDRHHIRGICFREG